jgi:predicted phage terminase large subunit-like protein
MSILKEVLRRIDVSGELEKQERIDKARKDFGFFCRYYLPHAFSLPMAEYQRVIIDIINSGEVKKEHVDILSRYVKEKARGCLKEGRFEGLLDIEPRDHGKTTRMAQAFPLWLVLTKQNVFPVIVSASSDSARDILESIRFELEHNERILEDFGSLKGEIWTGRKITLKNGNSIAALGAGQSARGIKDRYKRPTHIICDDLLKDQEVESKVSRDKVYKWFKRVVMNLGKGAKIIIVNTILHPDDLPSRLLKEIEAGTLKDWVGVVFSAITPEGKPLWPERWSLEDIEKKREQLGSFVFATEWMNEPIAEEERKFKPEWFQFYEPSELRNIKFERVVMAVDPATGKSTGDYSAIVVVGRTSNNQIYVLDAEGEKISDLALIRRIIDKYRAWRPDKILFEIQAFQEIYKNQLLREALKDGLVLPVKGIKHTVNKELRISKLSPLVEAGIILFKKTQSLLLQQLEEFPRGHDDLPDALEMAVSEVIAKRAVEPVAIPLGLHRHSANIMRGEPFFRRQAWL